MNYKHIHLILTTQTLKMLIFLAGSDLVFVDRLGVWRDIYAVHWWVSNIFLPFFTFFLIFF